MHQVAPPFTYSNGPRNAKLVIIGEAWGEKEDMFKVPFVGVSGLELARLLIESGLTDRKLPSRFISELDLSNWWASGDIFVSNVLAFRPPGNKIEAICVGKSDLPPGYPYPHWTQGKYIAPEYAAEVERLWEELHAVNPTLILALGNTACWGVLQQTRISTIRGVVTYAPRPRKDGSKFKVLPTFHPANILRNWAQRPIVSADLLKAAREVKYPEIRRPERKVIVAPMIGEIVAWVEDVLKHPPRVLSADIETSRKQITCIGFAKSRTEALVIPFVDYTSENYSYWDNEQDERTAWDCVEALMSSAIPKLFQNGLYDLQYILRAGIKCKACEEDTMLLHHSLFPELNKGLGFLGSIYTDEASWKLMREAKPDSEKRDE